MQLIRCTAKLLKEMGLKKTDLVDESPKFSFLGQWHANLIYINRRKCIIFVNDKILLNFIVADISRAQIRKLNEIFEPMFRCFLASEGFSKELVEKILAEYSEVKFAKSNNRSVLGSLNDLAFNYEYSICSSGGLHSPEVPAIIARLNRMPMRASVGYIYPLEELGKLCETAI
jgi:hypothetical protein